MGETMKHDLELHGLGKPPYRFIGHEQTLFQAAPGEPVKAGASCERCWQPIRDAYWIESSDGKRSKLGCECINRAGDKKLIDVVKREANRVKAARAYDRAEERMAPVFGRLLLMQGLRDALEARPHPHGFTDRETGAPLTALDYVEWMLAHSGQKGRKQVAKFIQKVDA
jgi:hypothetical protein